MELALFLTIKALIINGKTYLFDRMQGGQRAVLYLFTALKRLKIILTANEDAIEIIKLATAILRKAKSNINH